MRTRLPPNVTRERNRHDTVVYYYRVDKGPRTRLPEYGTPEFDAAYKAALAGEPVARTGVRAATKAGTVRWLVAEYQKTLHFRGLDVITQRRRSSFFQQMIDKSGDVPLSRITEKVIVASREKLTTGKGHAANNFLKAIKPMFAYAKTRQWIEVDPARTVDYVKPMKGSRLAWTIDDVKAFEAKYPLGTMPNLAMRVLLFTGLRRSDAAILGRQHISNGTVNFKPGKTEDSSGVEVTFSVLPPLAEAIIATDHLRTPSAGGVESLTLIRTEAGAPFASGASFGNSFRTWCVEAGIDARAHGLRKLGPTLAAENGATPHELMAMWGWTTLAQAELYTRAANRRRMAEEAAGKLMGAYDAANPKPKSEQTFPAPSSSVRE